MEPDRYVSLLMTCALCMPVAVRADSQSRPALRRNPNGGQGGLHGTPRLSRSHRRTPSLRGYLAGTALIRSSTLNGDVTGTFENLVIREGAVRSGALADGAVVAEKIADGTV
jgi:hypothetical protein